MDLWNSEPLIPEIRDGRLYGRGAADNKGPQIVHMAALHRVLSKNPEFPLHITYLIEGEEEIEVPVFVDFLKNIKIVIGDMLGFRYRSPGPDQLVVTTVCVD